MRRSNKFWGVVIFFVWGGVLFGDSHLLPIFDRHDPRPVMVVSLEAIPAIPPSIDYRRDVRLRTHGQWNAVIYNEAGVRVASRRGDGEYSPERTGGPWSWSEFFTDPENPLPAPKVPDHPYRVCANYYDMTIVRSGVSHEVEEACTELINP